MVKPIRKLITILAVCLIVCAALAACQNSVKSDGARESVMQRVLRTGVIRCGYLPYSSYFRKDPNSGKLSGIFHDVMEEIGKNAGLKIEWVEEVGYQGIFPGLDSNRFDVFCGGLWPNTTRAKAAAFSIPIFYSAITTWCRTGDNRFDKDLNVIDNPNIRVATIDGAMEDLITKMDYPKATRLSLPELSPWVQNCLNIIHNKADLTFAEPMVVNEFLKSNPGTLKQVQPDKPIRIFGNTLAVQREEHSLRDFLNVALNEMLHSGRVDKILARYESNRKTFYPVAKPYTIP